MKKIITLGVLFAFFACFNVSGQHLAVTCSSIEVRNVFTPVGLFHEIPNKQNQVIQQGCSFLANGAIGTITTSYTLYKVVNGSLINVGGPQSSPIFNNLSQGTYIASYSIPTARNSFGCPSGNGVFNLNGKQIGLMADFAQIATQFGPQVIGVPAGTDNAYTFLDGNNRTLFNSSQFVSYYDPSEPIRIDARASQNFDRYGVAILEFWPGGIPGRYRSRSTSVPSNIVNNIGLIDNTQRPLGIEDLKDLWDPTHADPNWQFIPGNSYRVQVTISNSSCASWVDNLQVFNICDALWNCRAGNDKPKIEPSISPNPVSRTFKMEGITFNPVSSVKDELVILDLTGRLVKNFKAIQNNEFDVSDLNTGVYFVSVLRDDHKLFTKKLIVSR